MAFLFNNYPDPRFPDPRNHKFEDYEGTLLISTVCQIADDIYEPPQPDQKQLEAWEKKNPNLPFDPASLFSEEKKNQLGEIISSYLVSQQDYENALTAEGIDPSDISEETRGQRTSIHKRLDDANLIALGRDPTFQSLMKERLAGRTGDLRVQEYFDYIKLLNKQPAPANDDDE